MKALKPFVIEHATLLALPPELVACVILQESGGDPNAARVEYQWFLRNMLLKKREQLAGWFPQPKDLPSLWTEKVFRATSWGPMQVLGDTARVLGYTDRWLNQLAEPALNIHLGCVKLAKCFEQAGYPYRNFAGYSPALLRYNGGGNEAYPGEVLLRLSSQQWRQILD